MKHVLAIFMLAATATATTDSPVHWQSDAAMHEYFVRHFLQSAGNGSERMIAPPMAITDSMWLTLAPLTFKLGTLELIGIANHQSPVAFVDLRHRAFGGNAETRTLTEFETQALKELEAGTNITSAADRRGRTVVGALRAQQECLGCHNRSGQKYQVGDLFGALSYRLDNAKLPVSLLSQGN